MAFVFDTRINPKKPIDVNFPPPKGWKVIDDYDRILASRGQASDLFKQCEQWEKQEISRFILKERKAIKRRLRRQELSLA